MMRSPNSVSTRSIGEVLALLKQEFSDISISKIRFLESQGLVTPERTQSGYRKFSDNDIGRLRYILRQQREHFLPLKVIKDRLDEAPEHSNSTAIDLTDSSENANVHSMLGGGALMGRDELINASGLTESQLRELERFGMIEADTSTSSGWYDEHAIIIARAAARLFQFGIEPRHLRIFKTAADREAELFRQLAAPVRTSRNTAARMESAARMDELTRLGESLRSELLRVALGGT